MRRRVHPRRPRLAQQDHRCSKELALTASDAVTLTPRQKTIRDAAEAVQACDRKHILADGTEFIGGYMLRDEIRNLDEQRGPAERRYQGKTDPSLSQVISEALPMTTVQLTVPGACCVRGYYVTDILAEWEKIRPADPQDVEIPEEADPFDVDEEAA